MVCAVPGKREVEVKFRQQSGVDPMCQFGEPVRQDRDDLFFLVSFDPVKRRHNSFQVHRHGGRIRDDDAVQGPEDGAITIPGVGIFDLGAKQRLRPLVFRHDRLDRVVDQHRRLVAATQFPRARAEVGTRQVKVAGGESLKDSPYVCVPAVQGLRWRTTLDPFDPRCQPERGFQLRGIVVDDPPCDSPSQQLLPIDSSRRHGLSFVIRTSVMFIQVTEVHVMQRQAGVFVDLLARSSLGLTVELATRQVAAVAIEDAALSTKVSGAFPGNCRISEDFFIAMLWLLIGRRVGAPVGVEKQARRAIAVRKFGAIRQRAEPTLRSRPPDPGRRPEVFLVSSDEIGERVRVLLRPLVLDGVDARQGGQPADHWPRQALLHSQDKPRPKRVAGTGRIEDLFRPGRGDVELFFPDRDQRARFATRHHRDRGDAPSRSDSETPSFSAIMPNS